MGDFSVVIFSYFKESAGMAAFTDNEIHPTGFIQSYVVYCE